MKIKHLLPIFTLVALLITPLNFSSAENPVDEELQGLMFSDVDENDENFNAIYFLHNIGFVKGYDTGKELNEYKPDQNINRAEFLTLILNGSSIATHEEFESCFKDVPKDQWYTTYVCQAKEEGWVSGYQDGTFRPGQTINEAETLRILGEIADWELADLKAGENWYEPYVDVASGQNILPSKPVDSFMTRGDIAEIIFRMIEIELFSLEAFDESLIDDLFENYGTSYHDDDGDDLDDQQDDVSDDANVDADADSPSTTTNISISLDKSTITADGENSTQINIFVTDESDTPLTDRNIVMVASTGRDYAEDIQVEEAGEGVYMAIFSSKLAGEFTLIATDEESNAQESVNVTVSPGPMDHVEIVDIIEPYESGEPNKASIEVVSKDVNENVLPYSTVSNTLDAFATFGTVEVTHDSKGTFYVELTTDRWGAADVTIRDKKTAAILSEPIQILFFPVQINIPKGISQKEGIIEAPMYVYFPEEYSCLGSYEFDLHYNPDILTPISIEDSNPEDNFDTPNFTVDEELELIHIWQTNNDKNLSSPANIEIGNILFEVTSVGSGSVYISDAVLTDKAGEEKGYLASFAETLGEAADAVGEIIGSIWDWVTNAKGTKDICLDAFVFPGDNTTQADITKDIAEANRIFKGITDGCNCKYYLNIKLNSTTNLTAADWTAIDADGDGIFDSAEMDTAVNNHPATNSCIPVYYVPRVMNNWIGVSWHRNTTNGIGMDHSADFDDKTLAHELVHKLSHNDNLDNGRAGSAAQGANDAKNLMNNSDLGDNLSVTQCEAIEKYLP